MGMGMGIAKRNPSLKLALLFPCYSICILLFFNISTLALNVGIQQSADSTGVTVKKECSRKCESDYCSVPPFLRYGKYCGLLYSGCPGEKPCDGLDACCMKHDLCIQVNNNDYLSQKCNQAFLNCIQNFKSTGANSFAGNTCDAGEVVDVITIVIDAALLAGRVLHKP